MTAATCFKVPILLQNTTSIYKWVIMTSSLEWVNYQILKGTGACKLIEDVQKVISRKMCASCKTDQQLCTGTYLPSGSSPSAHQLVASSFSIYLHRNFCMLSNLQVSEVQQVLCFALQYVLYKIIGCFSKYSNCLILNEA